MQWLMISGSAQADRSLFMVPSNKGGFETSMAEVVVKEADVQCRTRQLARLRHLLGIEQDYPDVLSTQALDEEAKDVKVGETDKEKERERDGQGEGEHGERGWR